MATTMVNGAPGNPTAETNTPTVAISGGGKQNTKSAATGNKSNDTGRKQGSNPGDGPPRRTVPQKAWTSGMNPITQRSTTPGQQNGAGLPNKASQKATSNEDTHSAEKIANDRLLYLFANFMGQSASITVKNGDVFSGIFFGSTMDNQESAYLLKMVQKAKSAEKAEVNGNHEVIGEYIGTGKDHSMSFDFKDVLHLAVDGVTFNASDKQSNGSAAAFRTDADISGNLAFRERELKPWASSAETDFDLNQDDSGGQWDQFATNERLFGLKSDYNENIYTTRIDRSNPKYRQREAEAQRIAREIEGTSTNSAHIREERGLADEDGGFDEEEKYSGVRRHAQEYPPLQSNQPNRYMPPARRPPSGKPTVAGAPVDPAIIASQIARPEVSPQRSKDLASDAATNSTTLAKAGDGASSELKNDSSKDISASKAATNLPADATKTSVPNATANVETEVFNSFKAFADKQKSKVADDRQRRARDDKAVKLNDLKTFSERFKLHTPVPKDLVPILTKDKAKQDDIIAKATRNAEQQSLTPPTKLGADLSSRSLADANRDAPRGPPHTVEVHGYSHHRQGGPPRALHASMASRDRQHQGPYAFQTSPPNGNDLLSHRFAEHQRAQKAGVGRAVPIPAPLPIHNAQKPSRSSNNAPPVSNSRASSTARTPTSAVSGKFNVKALEFKPNPAANTFRPIEPSAASSPNSNVHARAGPRAPSPSDFFGNKKPLSPADRPSIMEHFSPLKRLKEKAEKEGRTKDYAANGGIVYAHATPVTWSIIKDDEEMKSYKDLFDNPPAPSSGISPQPSTTSPMNPSLAHLHQLPAHLQHHGIPQGHHPQHPPFQGQHQQHVYPVPGAPPHFEDHRVHPSPSAPTYSTPRAQNNYVAYPPPMGPSVQFPYGQSMPHVMGPGHPQPPNFRQFSNGPQYMPSPGQQLAAPMMVQQNSQGGYLGPQGMAVPHMPMYAPGPIPSYNAPSQPPSGYPSPSRTAPMMVPQGSFQGQNPPVHAGAGQYPQPFYASQPPAHMTPMRGYPSPQPQPYSHSPQQQFHYPPQPSRMPSYGYGNHPQGATQNMSVQQPPPGATTESGEGMK